MPTTTVYDLSSTLKQTRLETNELIRQMDFETVIYPNSGWRVHDIITHLTWSDEHATAQINAFLTDTVYHPPFSICVSSQADVHRRNALVRRQRFNQNPQQVISESISAHEALKTAIFHVGSHRLYQEFSASWGERITTHSLAIWQIQHDQHHRRDLARVLGCPDTLDNRVYRLVYSET